RGRRRGAPRTAAVFGCGPQRLNQQIAELRRQIGVLVEALEDAEKKEREADGRIADGIEEHLRLLSSCTRWASARFKRLPRALSHAPATRSASTNRRTMHVRVETERVIHRLVESALAICACQRAGGKTVTITSVVADLTGRPPRTFPEFARDHAAMFRGSVIFITGRNRRSPQRMNTAVSLALGSGGVIPTTA